MNTPASTSKRAASAWICRTLSWRRPASTSETTLAAYLWQISLSEAVLRHQEAKHLDTGSIRQTVMLRIVRLDEHAEGFDQAITSVLGVVADLIDERIEASDGGVVLALVADGEEWFD
jgi:hypothetical protein